MSITSGKSVEEQLQTHVKYARSPDESKALMLGTVEQLSTAVRISSSTKIYASFRRDGTPREYPNLLPRNYLVACVDVKGKMHVVSVYTLNQMIRMQERSLAIGATFFTWKILEIPEKLESDLLRRAGLPPLLPRIKRS